MVWSEVWKRGTVRRARLFIEGEDAQLEPERTLRKRQCRVVPRSNMELVAEGIRVHVVDALQGDDVERPPMPSGNLPGTPGNDLSKARYVGRSRRQIERVALAASEVTM